MVVVLFLVIVFGVGQFFAFSDVNPSGSNGSNGAPSVPPTQVVQYTPSALPNRRRWKMVLAGRIPSRLRIGLTHGGVRWATASRIPASRYRKHEHALCGINPTNPNSTSSFILKLTQRLPPVETIPSSTLKRDGVAYPIAGWHVMHAVHGDTPLVHGWRKYRKL